MCTLNADVIYFVLYYTNSDYQSPTESLANVKTLTFPYC